MLAGPLLHNTIATPTPSPKGPDHSSLRGVGGAGEFHCQAFTGLPEKFFSADSWKQEMTVGEAAVELGSLMLTAKK